MNSLRNLIKINFSKMHGLENDFIVINSIDKKYPLTPKIVQSISNRHTGIGFDQLLLVEKTKKKNVDFNYRIFNSNGIEVSQCGNGARCLALFLWLKKLISSKIIYVSTNNRIMKLTLLSNNIVRVNMGIPYFEPKKIPYLGKKKKSYFIRINNKVIQYDIVTIGNPHCVIIVKNIDTYPVKKIGAILESHYLFPEGANINFMKVVSNNKIILRVYERGVGETRSCGSGACASVASGINKGLLSHNVKVDLLGGTLCIEWKGANSQLYMIGSANYIYDGYFYI